MTSTRHVAFIKVGIAVAVIRRGVTRLISDGCIDRVLAKHITNFVDGYCRIDAGVDGYFHIDCGTTSSGHQRRAHGERDARGVRKGGRSSQTPGGGQWRRGKRAGGVKGTRREGLS